MSLYNINFQEYQLLDGSIVVDSLNGYYIISSNEIIIAIPSQADQPAQDQAQIDYDAWSNGTHIKQIENAKRELIKTLSQRRWEIETGGINFYGSSIATDDRSKLLITGAWQKSLNDSAYSTEWKGADGKWTLITAPTIIAIYDAIFDHVQACFAREKTLGEQIDAASTLAALDALKSDIQAFNLA